MLFTIRSLTHSLRVPASAADYVQDGLILHLDGIQNTASGHDGSSTVWTNLAPASADRFPDGTIVGDLQWGDNCLNYGGQRGTGVTLNKTTKTFSELTIEVVYRTNSSGSYDSLIQNCEGSGEGFQIESKDNSNALTYIWYDSKLGYCRAPIQPVIHNRILYTGFARTSSEFTAYDTNLDSVSGSIVNSINAGSVPWAVGAGPTNGSSKFTDTLNGSIYSVRFYNRKLSAAEIAKNRAIDASRFNCAQADLGFTESHYFKPSSMIVHLDGINNTGAGHDSSATYWKNLRNSKNCAMVGDTFAWGNNHLIFEGATKVHGVKLDSIYTPTALTVEQCYERSGNKTGADEIACSCTHSGGWSIFAARAAGLPKAFIYTAGSYKSFVYDSIPDGRATLGFAYDSKNSAIILEGTETYTSHALTGTPGYNNSTYIFVGAEAQYGEIESSRPLVLDGNVYAFRLYNVALTDYQMAYNKRIDKARFNF